MSFNVGLKHGEIITNDKLREIFACGNMGGMRRSLTTNTLVIVSDHTKSLYEDKWIGDVLHYTGMGKKGNQELNKTQNKTLNESNHNGTEVHLFEVYKENNYIYRGIVKLIESPYREKQKDEDGVIRDVWVFPVKVVDGHGDVSLIDEKILQQNYEQKERLAKKLTNDELKNKALESQSEKTSVRKTSSQTYERNAFVTEYAKRRAKGVCQLCDNRAPFNNKSGEAYLETHHIIWLSEGGPDTVENTVALCPNCHRKMHVLNLKEDKQKLLQKAVVGE